MYEHDVRGAGEAGLTWIRAPVPHMITSCESLMITEWPEMFTVWPETWPTSGGCCVCGRAGTRAATHARQRP